MCNFKIQGDQEKYSFFSNSLQPKIRDYQSFSLLSLTATHFLYVGEQLILIPIIGGQFSVQVIVAQR